MSKRVKTTPLQNDDEGDDSWEDIPEENLARSTPRSSVPPSSPGRAFRRRRAPLGTKAVAYSQQAWSSIPERAQSERAQPERAQPERAQPERAQPEQAEPFIDPAQANRAVRRGAANLVLYVGGILADVARLMRKPLGVLLFLWLLSALVTRLNNSLRVVFAPFCIIPGISQTTFCASPPPPVYGAVSPWNGFGKLMELQGSTFEQLLDETATGSVLSLDMKKTQVATKDMVTLINISKLKSKDSLAWTLTEFSDEARKSARALQRFGSKVGGAVDSITAYHDYAFNTIAAANEKSSSALSRLNPFSTNPTREVVMQTFTDAMSVLSAQIERLIIEAELNIISLDRLEELLLTLHDIVKREDASVSAEHSELLSSLWTKLGMKQHELRTYEGRLGLLKDVSKYRTRALAHITGALQALQSISADMEELRERAAAPELLGASVPLEVHMNSIKGGIERLKEGRMRAKDRQQDVSRTILGPDTGLLD